MIVNTKCECGHQNHVGTVLCESCGKPLGENQGGTEPLEMRYDGVARRSQRANPNLLNRVWNFFSSVKVAIYLILATLVGSILGTIYPQVDTFLNIDPSKYYKETYGVPGMIYHWLGLSNTFGSWWFRLLLVMIGASLVICSLDRVLPLYRALSKQQIRKHLSFILRQRAVFQADLATSPLRTSHEPVQAEQWVNDAAVVLRKKGYKVHTDGGALLAEKHRFSRWGPYINHIGLIIFLLAVLMRSLPGWHMDNYMSFLEGETVKIPDTNYYLKNEKFTVSFYEEDEINDVMREKGQTLAKLFQTDAVLYECEQYCSDPLQEPVLKEVARHAIVVNDPLEYKGFLAYQFDFAETPQLQAVKPKLRNKETGEAYGPFEIRMKNPAPAYEAGPYRLELTEYFPDFAISAEGKPTTVSNNPNRPAFVFTMTGPDMPERGVRYMYFPREVDKLEFRQDDINAAVSAKWDISVDSMNDVDVSLYTTFLNLRIDRALPYIWIGSGIFMIGLIMGLYWHHRRIWLRFDDGLVLSLGAHTNKNWYGVRSDVAWMLKQMHIEVDQKQLSNEVKKGESGID